MSSSFTTFQSPVLLTESELLYECIKSHSEGIIDLMVGDQVTVLSTSGQWAGVRTSTGVVDWFPLPYLRLMSISDNLLMFECIKSHSEGLIDLMVGDQVTVSSTSGQWAGVRTSTGVVDWFPLPYLRQIKVIIVNIDNVYAY